MKYSESIGDIKKHWSIVKKVTGKANNKEETTTRFHYKGSWVESPQENAELINEYFSNIGKETNESVGQAKHPPEQYLIKHAQRNQYNLLFSEVTPEDVLDVCKAFTRKTSADAEGFKQNVILQDAPLLAPVLAHLVNCSQKTGKFPGKAKIARVIPVYKNKGDKHLYENYRPISLLPIFSKIMD